MIHSRLQAKQCVLAIIIYCSTHPVLKPLSAPDVSHVLLHLFGITYLTTFDLLELLEPFILDWRVIYFPSLHHRHAISLLIHWFTVKLAINITLLLKKAASSGKTSTIHTCFSKQHAAMKTQLNLCVVNS